MIILNSMYSKFNRCKITVNLDNKNPSAGCRGKYTLSFFKNFQNITEINCNKCKNPPTGQILIKLLSL